MKQDWTRRPPNSIVKAAIDFVRRVSKQKPEKPDYWCACGQCERNENDAEEIIDMANAQTDCSQAEGQ